jgi:hypothetical protein
MNKNLTTSISLALAVAAGLAAATVSSQAQGILATGILTDVPGGGGTFDYTLTVNNSASATTSIEGFWYAWIPGFFFLPTTPSSASGGVSGWSATIVSTSIQYQGTAGNAIAPGGSAAFTFVSTDSPATLAGNSQGHPIGDSYAYPGTISFSVSTPPDEAVTVLSVVPEPSTYALMLAGSFVLLAARRRKLHA